MILQNRKGATLMELMVAIPLGLFLVYGMSVALQDLFKNFYTLRAKNESLIAQDFLRDAMVTPASCTSHLQNSTRDYHPNLASQGKLQLAFSLDNTDDIVKSGSTLTKQNLYINSLTYRVLPEGVDYMADPLFPGNMLQYGMAVIEASKINTGHEIRNAPQILSGLVLSVDPNRKISRCFILDNSYDLCGAVGGSQYTEVTPAGAKPRCTIVASCPPGKIPMGVDGNGNAICLDVAQAVAQACPTKNTYLATDGTGKPYCRPLGGTPDPGGSVPVASTDPVPPPPPVPPANPCAASGAIPGGPTGTGMSLVGPALGNFGCFFSELGVHVIVRRGADNTWTMEPGPVPHPLYPFSAFKLGKTPDGSMGVTAPNGSFMGGT